jgi:hypothetical protein
MTLEEYIRQQEILRSLGGGQTTQHYLGNVVPDRQRIPRPLGLTDMQVDYYSRPSAPISGLNFMGRPPRSFYDPNAVNPEADAARQAYGDVARLRATQTSPLPMGLPSGYGQEEGGMSEPYTGLRPSGTFARGTGMPDDLPSGNIWWGTDYFGEPIHGMFGTSQDTVKSAGEVGGGGAVRMREVEAEEGPASAFNFSASALSKAAEMIAAADGDTAGARTRTGGSTRPYPKPLMAGPTGITAFAPTYLRGNKKREDELYG